MLGVKAHGGVKKFVLVRLWLQFNALPKVDYTKWRYRYPELMARPPVDDPSLYPPLQTLGRILNRWPQDDLDRPPDVLEEALMHFDYSDPMERAAAVRFRDAELPFKVYNVPELDAATAKWADDDYVGRQFAGHKIHGVAQESTDHFFSFFRNDNWNVEVMGPPPSVDTDFSFTQWARHARFADTFGLDPQSTHYYWQSGVPQNERFHSQRTWSFVSKDLPSFSDTEPNFFAFNPKEQKGIQCRFGERGVVAATHYDSGRNMVAMITGAKRYILSPPKACGKLGIIAHRKHPAFRHSLLNFGHITLLNDTSPEAMSMSDQERAWLELAQTSPAVDTVLKAGEVLYIPSHWFHYIISLQKSAQCNTRSGRDKYGTEYFGGGKDVERCVGENY